MANNWQTDPVDFDWFLDSGLLFEVNRQYFHPFGVAMTVVVGPDGEKGWGFKDMRADPGSLKFEKGAAEAGSKKFAAFLKEWGRKQMDKRAAKLGQSVQHVERVAE